MRQVIVITDQRALFNDVRDWATTGPVPHWIVPRHPLDRPLSAVQVLDTFRQLADGVAAAVAAAPVVARRAVAVIDFHDDRLTSLDALDPITNSGPGAVVAMLVLAFPDVHFAFHCSHGTADDFIRHAHLITAADRRADLDRLDELGREEFTPLFDPTGLRQRIVAGIKGLGVPHRGAVAAAVDDEEQYAYFHAYVAYRFGFRGHVVRSVRMLDRLYGPAAGGAKPDCGFEDLYLSFPDRVPRTEAEAGLSDLADVRDVEYPTLCPKLYRVFVTSGPHGRHDPKAADRNREHLAALRRRGVRSRWLRKPISGVYDLWTRSGLQGWLPRGRAAGFVWPPRRPSATATTAPGEVLAAATTTHSAPGQLLAVAERLVERARGVGAAATAVTDAVHGAVLALSAKELLAGRTPTTAIEALSVQHQLEAAAECMFYGVEYNFDVDQRFRDLKAEVEAIGVWFHRGTRRNSERNARANILNHLVPVFRKYGQFEEELACLNQARLLQWPVWTAPLQHYLGRLVGSFRDQFLAWAGWILAFAVLYWLVYTPTPTNWPGRPSSPTFMEWVVKSAEIFLLVSSSDDYPKGELTWRAIRCLEYMCGFTHMGIFASRLFLLLLRR